MKDYYYSKQIGGCTLDGKNPESTQYTVDASGEKAQVVENQKGEWFFYDTKRTLGEC